MDLIICQYRLFCFSLTPGSQSVTPVIMSAPVTLLQVCVRVAEIVLRDTIDCDLTFQQLIDNSPTRDSDEYSKGSIDLSPDQPPASSPAADSSGQVRQRLEWPPSHFPTVLFQSITQPSRPRVSPSDDYRTSHCAKESTSDATSPSFVSSSSVAQSSPPTVGRDSW